MKFRRLLALIMSTLMVASCVSFASAQEELPAEEIAEEAVMAAEEAEEEAKRKSRSPKRKFSMKPLRLLSTS